MTLNFLPGEPNRAYSAVAMTNWNAIPIFVYCSGNNLVILTNHCHHLQTIYLDRDPVCVDINRVNGKIAISLGSEVHVYKPLIRNFYSFNFGGRKNVSELEISWGLEIVIGNEDDDSKVNCLNWADVCDSDDGTSLDEYNSETSSEIVVGSDRSLTLWRLFYKDKTGTKTIASRRLWYKPQANPVYMVKFSPNSTTIASVGFYDTLLKLWHRVSFGIETSEFDVVYQRHSGYITNLRWRGGTNSSGMGGATSGVASPIRSSVSTVPSRRAGSVVDVTSLATSVASERDHNVLYAYSSDGSVRLWTTFFAEGDYQVLFSGAIDLYEGSPVKQGTKYCVFIDNDLVDFGLRRMLDGLDEAHTLKEAKTRRTSIVSSNTLSVPGARSRSGSTVSYYRQKEEYLQRLLGSNLELALIINEDGTVCLYGLTNVSQIVPGAVVQMKLGIKSFQENSHPVQIRLGENCMPKQGGSLFFQDLCLASSGNETHKDLTLMVHDIARGSVRQVAISFDELFQFEPITDGSGLVTLPTNDLLSSSDSVAIGTLAHKFTGHNKSIQKFVRSNDGSACLSVTRFCESFLWYPISLDDGSVTLSRRAIFTTDSPIKNAIILQGGDYVITHTDDTLTCWDCRTETIQKGTSAASAYGKLAVKLCTTTVGSTEVLSLLVLPETNVDSAHVVAIYAGLRTESWELVVEGQAGSLRPFSTEPFPEIPADIHLVVPVDPVGWTAKINKGSPSERDMLSVISKSGAVSVYSVSLKDNKINWLLKSSFNTGIPNAAQIKGSSLHKLAIVDEDHQSLSIWDTRACVLEFEDSVLNSDYTKGQRIKDIDWTCTDFNQSVLAVGFSSFSALYTQLRYDYTNETPAYRAIKLIDVSKQTTHEIGDSLWLKDGTLVIGAGNQLYVSDKHLEPERDVLTQRAMGTIQIHTHNLFHLCRVLNGPLPAYHPQLIIQILYLGKFKTVERILCVLAERLREISLDPESDPLRDVDPTLGLSTIDFASDAFSTPPSGVYSVHDGSESELTPPIAQALLERLRKIKLPFLTSHQQITLVSTIEIILDILQKHSKTLDINGMRFFLGVKLFQVNQSKSGFQGTISMRDVNFALHSDNKDILFNIVESQGGERLTWSKAKAYGLPYWLSVGTLIEQAELIAKNEFLDYSSKHDGKRDPFQCSLFYLALKKKHILQGLWKTSTGHPEQQKMMKFLANDFNEPRWKSAALKNAFALLGRHRYQEAASFFLLAGALKDSVNVILKQMVDIPLAILVCICYEESDKGPILSQFLKDRVLPEAMKVGDRWTASWVFWKLGNRPLAIQALVKHSHQLVDDPELFGAIATDTARKLLEQNGNGAISRAMEDPVLLLMYDNLRSRNVDYLRGALRLSANDEFEFVLRVSYYYTRMGCDYISVYLVRNWKFMTVDADDKKEAKSAIDAPTPKIFSSPKQDFSNRFQPPPSAFVEPDMSAFDFGM